MKVLLALTYYRPHTSGLTIYVERLARALADRGHRVTVLTAQYDKSLPREEHLHGVEVVRVPVAFRVSKGVIMPTFGAVAWQMVRSHDVLSLHLPQFDASGLAARGRLLKKPVTLTYHCDLQLPPGLFSRIVDKVVFGSNVLAAQFADTIVAYTKDYATHSPFLSRHLDKVQVIPPPVHVPDVTADEIAAFKRQVEFGRAARHRLCGAAGDREGRGGHAGSAAARLAGASQCARVICRAVSERVGRRSVRQAHHAFGGAVSSALDFPGRVESARDGDVLPQLRCHRAAQFELDRIVWPGASGRHVVRRTLDRQCAARRASAGDA